MTSLPERTPVPTDLVRSDAPTEKQERFLRSLLDEREIEPERRAKAIELLDAGEMTKKQASASIEMLLTLPKNKNRPKYEGWPAVPDGRYALEFPDDPLNPVRFYKVNTGAESNPRWAGFRFVERFVSDETFPVKGADREHVMDAIAEDPERAARRFGAEERACGICGRRLTRRISRAMGIGPVCAEKAGWGADLVSVREAIIAEGFDPDETIDDANEPNARIKFRRGE